MEADTSFELASGGSIVGNGFGDAVVISASGFANVNGANAIRGTNRSPRWLLYIDTFAGNEGVEPGQKQPDLYGRPHRTYRPPRLAGFRGNRIVYGTPSPHAHGRVADEDLRHCDSDALLHRKWSAA